MPRYIVKLTDSKTNTNYYLEWSTVVDAPVTYGMSLDEFMRYYRDAYGSEGMKDLPNRLKRVEEKGTSSQINETVESVIFGNRAGEGETEMSIDEIITEYCVNRPV